MKNMKSILTYILFCIIVLGTFSMPQIMIKLADSKQYGEIYEITASQLKLESAVEKIYLVRAIHSVLYNLEMASLGKIEGFVKETSIIEKEQIKAIQKEIDKLKEFEILADKNIPSNSANITESMRGYYMENEFFVIKDVNINDDYILIEEKTGKIISINSSKGRIYKKLSEEQILRSYIHYLELDIIDDWKYESNTLKSEKAKLELFFYEDNTSYKLRIEAVK